MGANEELDHLFKPLHDSLVDGYHTIEATTNINRIESRVSYVSPVNFTESMSRPRHRWFPYKEGFSPSFVTQFLKEHVKESSGTIYDPFSGVGTTALEASRLGYFGLGTDTSPLSTFVAQTKATVLNPKELEIFEDTIDLLSSSKLYEMSSIPNNKTVISYYESDYLDALMRVKAFITTIENKSIRNLFLLAFLSSVELFSTHRKAGNGVKRKSKIDYQKTLLTPTENVRRHILSLARLYRQDVAENYLKRPPLFIEQSCLSDAITDQLKDTVGVLTSPPYANCFDYSKIYMRELWLGDFFNSTDDQKEFRQGSIRSHVHATWEDRHSQYSEPLIEDIVKPAIAIQKLWSNKIGDMLSGYFKDMGKLFFNLGENLSSGTRVGLVVSNSFYGGLPIATDLLLSQLAERHGFKSISIDIYRGMIPSSQQYKRIEDKYFMRESLVVVEKL